MDFLLAELNIGRLHEPLDHPDSAEFVAALDAVNMLAERTPGFMWRLKDDDGQSSSYVMSTDDPLDIINLSVWDGVESLKHFMYKSGHNAYLRRRREWFRPPAQPTLVCWWTPADEMPTPEVAMRRLDLLRRVGPRLEAFNLNVPFPKPES